MKYPTKKIGEVCEVVGGGTPSTRISEYWDGDVVWITPKDMGKLQDSEVFTSEKTISEEGLKKSSAKLLPAGSVVLSSRAPIGYVAIAEVPLATNQGCRSFICDEQQLFNKYLYYFLVSKTAYLNSLGGGSTFKEVSGSKLKEIEIPLPPLAEQKKIVAKLEMVLGKIKEAKRLRAEAEAATSTLLSAELHKIFERPDYPEVALGDLGKMIVGGTPSRANPEYWGGNIPWVASKELNNMYIESTDECITDIGLKESNAKVLPKSTLLIGMYDTAALKMSIARKGISSNQAIIGLLPSANFLPEFVYYQLLYLRPRVMLERSGVRQQNLNSSKIKAIQIKYPPLAEQKKIVAHLDALAAKIARVREYQKSTAADLDVLEKSILAKAFAPQGKVSKETTTADEPQAEKLVPSPFWRNQVIAAIIEQANKDGGETTEVAVAKYNYLLQEVMGLSLGYEFQTHFFGPFDGKIKQLMYSGLGKNKWFAKRRGNIVPGSKMGALLFRKSNLYKDARSAMSELSQKGITRLDATRLELLSTICHAIKCTQSTDLDRIRAFMSTWNTNDGMTKAQKFSQEHIEKCLRFILKEGLQEHLLN